jgi:hypothetical protein
MNATGPAPTSEVDRLLKTGRLDEALTFAQRAVAGARVCLPAHGFLASVLMKLGRVADAEEMIAQAAELATGVGDAYDGLAFVSMALGQHERSNALYRRATDVAPGDPRFWYNLACSERSLGRLAEAEAACDRAIALDATQYPTYLLRSELRVQSPESNHIGELEKLLNAQADEHRARMFLGYALGKELDDVGRFDEAFHWFAAAAKARRMRLAYDVSTDEHKLSRIAEAYPRESCLPLICLKGPWTRPAISSSWACRALVPRWWNASLRDCRECAPTARPTTSPAPCWHPHVAPGMCSKKQPPRIRMSSR